MIFIINYGVNNITSVSNCLTESNIPNQIINRPESLRAKDKIILPGVGSFRTGVRNLKERNLDTWLKTAHKKGIKILGICLGMQLLYERSEESSGVDGLGILPGTIEALDTGKAGNARHHIGWNSVSFKGKNLFFEKEHGEYFYFNHSYTADSDMESVALTTEHESSISAAIECGNIYGTQFHPEKSYQAGRKLLVRYSQLA